MITDYIERYLDHPEVFTKVANAFPQAHMGLPEGIKTQNLTSAIYEMSKKAYIQRKQRQLISEGVNSLKDL